MWKGQNPEVVVSSADLAEIPDQHQITALGDRGAGIENSPSVSRHSDPRSVTALESLDRSVLPGLQILKSQFQVEPVLWIWTAQIVDAVVDWKPAVHAASA